MSNFEIYNADTAPEGSREILAGTQKALGFVPNLYGTFAAAPAVLEAYQAIGNLLNKSSLSATEQQVVLLAASRVNDCRYCIAAHTVVAGASKVARDVVDAIRDDRPIADTRLEALRRFTVALVEKQGWPSATDVAGFKAAGYGEQQILEVILGISLKTISNYTNHVAETPLDPAFQTEFWEPLSERTAA